MLERLVERAHSVVFQHATYIVQVDAHRGQPVEESSGGVSRCVDGSSDRAVGCPQQPLDVCTERCEALPARTGKVIAEELVASVACATAT